MDRNDMKNLKYILSKKKMTELQAVNMLLDKGLIRKHCE
jgi:hypothetical protein